MRPIFLRSPNILTLTLNHNASPNEVNHVFLYQQF